MADKKMVKKKDSIKAKGKTKADGQNEHDIDDTPSMPTPQTDEAEFRNITSRNIFTTKGRVAHGETIIIPTAEGNANPGLEIV